MRDASRSPREPSRETTMKTAEAKQVTKLDRAHEELFFAIEAASKALKALGGNDDRLLRAVNLLKAVRTECRTEADRLEGE
jgi:hypothetical protein